MMAKSPRIVAELGRPETPDETAARKAESSRVHRESQNTRNLVAALIVTIAIVMPFSSLSFVSSFMISALVAVSRLPVGSSANSTCG